MHERHELSRGWRGAPWGRRLAFDWDANRDADAPRRRAWRPLVLAVLLGLAFGIAVAGAIARDDRARLDALLAAAA